MKTVLVLGGGGVRGMAHAGVWRALVEADVEVSAVVGTSTGAIVAACIGAGDGPAELQAKALALRKRDIALLNRWVVLLNGIRQQSVFQGETLLEYIRRVVPATSFETLGLEVAINAVDVGTGETVWFGAGGRSDVALHDAVSASCALPVFYPPYAIGGSYYLDGGMLDPLPLEHAAALGADRIIAVDVGGGGVRNAEDVVTKGLVSIHQRVTEIMGQPRKRRLLATWAGPPLVYIKPALEAYSTFDFDHTEVFLEEGYRAAREALAVAAV